MSGQRAFQSTSTHAEQTHRRAHRCYSQAQLLVDLEMSRSTFLGLLKRGKLPFVVELLPRIGKHARYRADLIDRYLAGQWQQPRAFGSVRRHAGESDSDSRTSSIPK